MTKNDTRLNDVNNPALRRSRIINDRVIYSLLRTYGPMAEAKQAREVFRKQLLPLMQKEEQRKKGSMGALTEKAFEALMYVSGISGQRELGLEIAKTVRRRLWGKQQLEKLAIAYMNGRRQRPRMASNSLFLGVVV